MDGGSTLVEVDNNATLDEMNLRLANVVVETLMLSRSDQHEIGMILALAVALHARRNCLLVTDDQQEEFLDGWRVMLPIAVRVVVADETFESERKNGGREPSPACAGTPDC